MRNDALAVQGLVPHAVVARERKPNQEEAVQVANLEKEPARAKSDVPNQSAGVWRNDLRGFRR